MFLIPDDINQKNIYDYIYRMIQKSKDDFFYKYRDKLSGGFENSGNLNFKAEEYDINFDLHNRKQIILLRQFSEAIIRLAYLKYLHIDIPLHTKLKNIIDNYIKANTNFKNKKTFQSESSQNQSSILIEIKANRNFENNMENFISTYENSFRGIFKEIYMKSTLNIKKTDMTITYRFLYDNVLKKIRELSFLDIFKYAEMMNMYHKDRMIISDENKYSKETYAYVENLLDMEMIFFEFCEIMYFICKKFLAQLDLGENRDTVNEFIKLVDGYVKRMDYINIANEKYSYNYPKLNHHFAYEALIETRKRKEIEERKRQNEIKRYMFERKMLSLEDIDVNPEEKQEEYNSIDEEEEDEDMY